MAFALSFFLEAYGNHLPLLLIKAQHPSIILNRFAFKDLFFAGAGTLTFAFYEIFFRPEFLKKQKTHYKLFSIYFSNIY